MSAGEKWVKFFYKYQFLPVHLTGKTVGGEQGQALHEQEK
jgi:hypothetical protein